MSRVSAAMAQDTGHLLSSSQDFMSGDLLARRLPLKNQVGRNLHFLLGRLGLVLCYWRVLRQLHNKFCLTRFRLKSNIAAKMFGHNFVCDAKSQSSAHSLGLAGEEWLEDVSSIFLRNSGPIITHAHQDISVFHPGSHRDVSPLRRSIHRIVQQIHPYLVQPRCR